jgi:hypothetical protein
MKEDKKNNNHFYNKMEAIDGIDDADVPPLVYEKTKGIYRLHIKKVADFVAGYIL